MTASTEPGDPLPYSSPDVMQNVSDLYADMQRDREQHGPRLRELRCTQAVSANLAALWPEAPERKPWEPAPIYGIPVLEDEAIPGGVLRLVYGDGTTKDVIVNADLYLAGLAAELLSEPLTFTPPPRFDSFTEYYRAGYRAQSTNYSPIWGISV